MEISVIICTYNRERYLRPLLDSLVAQDYPPADYEIVLVNNCSTDGTEAVCRQFAASHPGHCFRYVEENQQGLSHARNRGLAESRGNLLIYIDDDATLYPHALSAYVRFLHEHPEVWAAGGPITPFYESPPPSWLSPYTRDLLTGSLDRGTRVGFFTHGRYPGGGNACYRRVFFERFGGFNIALGRKGNNLMGAEEKDLFSRYLAAGGRIGYVPDAGIFHYIPGGKLTREHLVRLSHGVGLSERQRTRSVSAAAFRKRLVAEAVKWGASLALFGGYALRGQVEKGVMLVVFRYWVSRGLLGGGLYAGSMHFHFIKI